MLVYGTSLSPIVVKVQCMFKTKFVCRKVQNKWSNKYLMKEI